MTTWQEVYRELHAHGIQDEATYAEEFENHFGLRLRDITPERALELIYRADMAAAGMSDMENDGRYNRAFLTRVPKRVETHHANAWLTALHAREEKT